MNPTPAPAQLSFVSNLFASKIFWTQVVALVAMIATAAGYHLPWLETPGSQEQLVGYIDMAATFLLRWLDSAGPVSIFAPFSTPAGQPVPVGASVVHVAAPADAVQVTAVQPIDVGVHRVEVTPPAQVGQTTPESVTVIPQP